MISTFAARPKGKQFVFLFFCRLMLSVTDRRFSYCVFLQSVLENKHCERSKLLTASVLGLCFFVVVVFVVIIQRVLGRTFFFLQDEHFVCVRGASVGDETLPWHGIGTHCIHN